ncbi:unnamed protein product [Rotaria socialis]|uniref:Uncharacterized protein n=1 Tax=Rotaria socialis TaxID=392032 RepID=A0A820C672_9BILA|nr:unnamed protein product [Rotaria socialis]CAF4381946.1 unnamed protein product [Rotaria socialis]
MSTPIIVTLANISKKYYYIYSLKTFREYASAFYLCDMSFANIGNMISATVVESSQAIKIHDVPCEKGPMIDSCGEKLGRTATNLKLCEAKKKENYAANLRINDILLKLISEQETTDNALLNEDDETFSNQGQ